MRLYTAFSAEGVQRCNLIGLPVLCRTLQGIREYVREGDTVQAYGGAGHSAGTWIVFGEGSRLVLRKSR